MDFSIPGTMPATLGRVREVVDRHVIPLETALLSRPFRESRPALAAVRDVVGASGPWAPRRPETLGGMGLSLLEFALVVAWP